MGHIVNPVGTHVGVSYSWRFKFLSYRKCDYKYYVDITSFFNRFLDNFFNGEEFQDLGIAFHFLKLMASRGVLNLLVYAQDSAFITMERNDEVHLAMKQVVRSAVPYRLPHRGKLKSYVNKQVRERFRANFDLLGEALGVYASRLCIWFVVKRLAFNYMLLFFPQLEKHCNFYILLLGHVPASRVFFNATVVARYFVRKFAQRHRLRDLARPVVRLLSRSPLVKGFKLSFSGRFSREERATYEWVKRGAVSLNKFTDIVEYDNDVATLKFGVVCVKVWINYRRKNAPIVLADANLIVV